MATADDVKAAIAERRAARASSTTSTPPDADAATKAPAKRTASAKGSTRKAASAASTAGTTGDKTAGATGSTRPRRTIMATADPFEALADYYRGKEAEEEEARKAAETRRFVARKMAEEAGLQVVDSAAGDTPAASAASTTATSDTLPSGTTGAPAPILTPVPADAGGSDTMVIGNYELRLTKFGSDEGATVRNRATGEDLGFWDTTSLPPKPWTASALEAVVEGGGRSNGAGGFISWLTNPIKSR